MSYTQSALLACEQIQMCQMQFEKRTYGFQAKMPDYNEIWGSRQCSGGKIGESVGEASTGRILTITSIGSDNFRGGCFAMFEFCKFPWPSPLTKAKQI